MCVRALTITISIVMICGSLVAQTRPAEDSDYLTITGEVESVTKTGRGDKVRIQRFTKEGFGNVTVSDFVTLSPTAKYSLDGKPAKAKDVFAGQVATFTVSKRTQLAVTVELRSKEAIAADRKKAEERRRHASIMESIAGRDERRMFHNQVAKPWAEYRQLRRQELNSNYQKLYEVYQTQPMQLGFPLLPREASPRNDPADNALLKFLGAAFCEGLATWMEGEFGGVGSLLGRYSRNLRDDLISDGFGELMPKAPGGVQRGLGRAVGMVIDGDFSAEDFARKTVLDEALELFKRNNPETAGAANLLRPFIEESAKNIRLDAPVFGGGKK